MLSFPHVAVSLLLPLLGGLFPSLVWLCVPGSSSFSFPPAWLLQLPLPAPLSSSLFTACFLYGLWPSYLCSCASFSCCALAHEGGTLRSSFLVGLTVRGLLAFESCFRTLSKSLSYAMWVLSVLLCLFRLLGFPSSDPSLLPI